MCQFSISGYDGYVKLCINEVYGFPEKTSHYGGYDVKGYIEIKSKGYYASGDIWFTTGEVFLFYEGLRKAYDDIKGESEFCTTDSGYLKVNVGFQDKGKVFIKGIYQETYSSDNELTFVINSDQSYFSDTLRNLKMIVNEYGNLEGKK